MALASGSERFRVPKTSSQETAFFLSFFLVNDTVPPSTKYKNKWAVNMDVLSLNYWLSKFVLEVAKKSGERYPPKSVYGIICSLKRHLEERNGSEALNPLDASDKRYLTTFKSNILGPSTSVVSTNTCTTIEKREEQDESIALKDVVFQKGNFNNCTINVSI